MVLFLCFHLYALNGFRIHNIGACSIGTNCGISFVELGYHQNWGTSDPNHYVPRSEYNPFDDFTAWWPSDIGGTNPHDEILPGASSVVGGYPQGDYMIDVVWQVSYNEGFLVVYPLDVATRSGKITVPHGVDFDLYAATCLKTNEHKLYPVYGKVRRKDGTVHNQMIRILAK